MFKLNFSSIIKAGGMTLSLSTIACSSINHITHDGYSNSPLTHKFTLSVTNPLNKDRSEETITLSKAQLTQLPQNFNFNAFKIFIGTKEIASQAVDVDVDVDGITDQLIFNSQLNAFENKIFTVEYNSIGSHNNEYNKRTHAELSINKGGSLINGKYQGGKFVPVKHQQLPNSHVIGDLQFKYEGPGWESDKIAYRLYFDHRNVIDIFGKKISDIVLPKVGQPGSNYHKNAEWGMDILKVGDSLGIGGIGMMSNGKVHRVETAEKMEVNIVEDGPLRSKLQIIHNNWVLNDKKYDLKSELTINAGSKLTHNSLTITGAATNLVTGIVKHKSSNILTSNKSSQDWAYIATFGRQSDIKDELGMAIFYKQSAKIRVTEDKNNHLVIMKPKSGQLDYYFLGSWAQDSDNIKTQAEFKNYLDNRLAELNNPLNVSLRVHTH